jgi:hypothetical protein
MSARDPTTADETRRGRAVVSMADILAGPRDRERRDRPPGSHPVPAFIAQLCGARVRRRRLALAREDAPSIHRAYRRGSADMHAARSVDISV